MSKAKIWIGLWFGSDESVKPQVQRFKHIHVSNLPRAGEWLRIGRDDEFLIKDVYHEFQKKQQHIILNCHNLPLKQIKYYPVMDGWLTKIPR